MFLKNGICVFLSVVCVFGRCSAGPNIISLEERCNKCNGTLEYREGGLAHCIVTNNEDMESAQVESAKALQQGLTMIPELKENSNPTSTDGVSEQMSRDVMAAGAQRMVVKQGDTVENADEGRVDDFQLVTASNGDLDGTVFMDESNLNANDDRQNESVLMDTENQLNN